MIRFLDTQLTLLKLKLVFFLNITAYYGPRRMLAVDEHVALDRVTRY